MILDCNTHVLKAIQCLEKSERHHATLHLRAAITLDPNHGAANALLGELALHNKQYQTAIALFETAKKTNQDNVLIRNNLGLALHKAGFLKRAADEFKGAIKIDSNHVAVLCNFANVLVDESNIQSAVTVYNRILAIARNTPQVLYNLAGCYKALGCQKEAISTYKQCISVDGSYVKAHLDLALVYIANQKIEKARHHLQRVLTIDYSVEDAHLALANLHLAAGEVQSASFAYANHGAACVNKGKYAAAIESLRHALKLNDRNQPAHVNLSCALMHQNNWQMALLHARIALDLAPGDSRAHHNYSLALLGNERPLDALNAASKAVELCPSFLEYRLTQAKVLMSIDAERSALAYRQVLQIDNANVVAHRHLGFFELKKHNWNEAYRHLSIVHSHEPHSADVCDDLAMSCHGRDELQEALEYHQKALRLDKNNPTYLTHVALTFSKLGHHLAAVHANKMALEVMPSFGSAHNNMANSYRDMNAVDLALGSYEKAISTQPDLWEAHINYGNLLKELGQFKESESAYLKAISINSNAMRAIRQLSIVNPPHVNEPRVAKWEELFLSYRGTPTEKAHLAFALGSIYHQSENVDKAFAYYKAGNELHRSTFIHDENEFIKVVDDIIEIFDNRMLDRGSIGSKSTKPIFIIGLPRSGTTLVEQILSSHTSVAAAGEKTWMGEIANSIANIDADLTTFPQNCKHLPSDLMSPLANIYLQQLSQYDTTHVTDKMPINVKYVGLIHLLFPEAVIIHVKRDSVETGFSIFQHHFSGNQPFAYSLSEIAMHIRAHQRLVDHWESVLPNRVVHVSYKDLVLDPERQIEALLSHCGLPWEEKCMRFYENPRRVKTASLMQVRKPIFTSGLFKSQRYAAHLKPLIDGLKGN